jgi:hypothetical protein
MAFQYQHNHQQVDRSFQDSNPHRRSHPQPREESFEELRAERSYLINCLQREDHRATELLRRATSLQELLLHSNQPGQRRKKRTLGWMKYQLGEATRQETTILGRLIQVTHKLQDIERLNWSNDQKRYEQSCIGSQMINLGAVDPEFQNLGNGRFSEDLPEPRPCSTGFQSCTHHEIALGSPEPYASLSEATIRSSSPVNTTSRVRPASMFEFGTTRNEVKWLSTPELSSI